MNELLAILFLMFYSWQPLPREFDLLSNTAIALAYAAILIILIYIQRKRGDLPFNDIFLLFAVFSLLCGTNYAVDISTLWHSGYGILGWLKLLTALVSLVTAIALGIKIPQILTLASPTETNKLEQQLEQQRKTIRQQKQFIRNIYDDVREAIFVVNVIEGKFYYQGFNAAAHRLTGIEDVANKTPKQIFPPEVAAKIEQNYRKCLQLKKTITYEERLSYRGQDSWWLTSLNLVEDESGIYRLVGTSLNISDRKQAEAELDRERQFLQALLDNLSDGIVACDRHGVITLFNQATSQFHGLPQQGITAERWAEYYDLYLPNGNLMTVEDIPLFRALQGESVRDVEMKISPKQGKPRTLLANGDPIIDSNGEKIGAIVAMRDITERQQAEAELKRERVFIKTMLDNLSDGIVACDRDGVLALFNQASQEFFGTTQKPLPPERWAEHYSLYDSEGKNYLKQEDIPLFRAFSGETFTDVELMVIPKQGQARTLLANGSPIVDSNGVKMGAVVVVRDITERKQAEQAIAQLNNELEARVKQRTAQLEKLNAVLLATTSQLEKRNQELDRFAYVTSHDLKAPLRAIANLSQWIEEDLADKLDDETRYNMNLLRGRVHRLENLINGLLAYSRVGRVKFDSYEVAVGKMLAEIIDSLDISEHFQIEIQGQMPTFVTEVIPLQQVFSNLISNAIKHSDCLQGKIIISVTEQAYYYEFAVADNGKGIDPKYHDRIFTIFQTLESRDTKESTGIGLAIVKKTVEDRGGRIEVESRLGEGSIFRFTWKKK